MPRGIGLRELRSINIATTTPNPSEADTSHQDPVSTTKSTQELAEKMLNKYVPEDGKDDTDIVLRSFLGNLPDDGRWNICSDILECAAKGKLRELRGNLVTALLLPIKARGRTLVVEISPRNGAEANINEIGTYLEPSSRKDQADLKRSCLRRDNHRCLATGMYDTNAPSEIVSEEMEEVQTAFTECAHIIPFSFGDFTESQSLTTATTWDTLYRCFPSIRSQVNLGSSTINDPSNALTLLRDLHKSFGSFTFALEPKQDEQDVYLMRRYRKFPTMYLPLFPKDGVVKLTNHDPSVPPPSPTLLGAHAAIAKVLHATGLGEAIDKIMEERKDIGCLASDGTTDVEALLLIQLERYNSIPFQPRQIQSQGHDPPNLER